MAPLAVLLRVASGENQLVQIYETITCERERTRVGARLLSLLGTRPLRWKLYFFRLPLRCQLFTQI